MTWLSNWRRGALLVGAAVVLAIAARHPRSSAAAATVAAAEADAPPAFLDRYCARCHNDIDAAGHFSIEDLRASDLSAGRNREAWEKILRRTSVGEMPPLGRPRPDDVYMTSFDHWLTGSLDDYATAHPDPGRAGIRRLNRAEYANAVRDLLDLDVDFGGELPTDNSGYGFDNIADVLTVSPMLMDRYVAVAGKVARLATGETSRKPFVTSYEVPKDGSILNQGRPSYNERASADLPLGSRGGGSFRYYARHDAVYEIAGTLNANTNNETDRLKEDRYAVRVPLKAGAHVIGLSFPRDLSPDETVQTLHNNLDAVPLPTEEPTSLTLDFAVDGRKVGAVAVPSYRMHPRYAQANFLRDVLQIDVTGPIEASGAGTTPSRRRIFSCRPSGKGEEAGCARRIVAALARRAYRRPATKDDLAPLMRVYAEEARRSGFEPGVEAAVEAILVSPAFLFVVERDPPRAAPGTVHRLADLDLATRLSLFLWSSIPDEELLRLAERERLHDPVVLQAQIGRMLADQRADALVHNFAGQWLYLRNLDQQRPDIVAFPAFDARLRAAMGRETELFFGHVLRDDRSLTDFLAADYTYLNQRLAEHYGIAGVKGTAFRRVALAPGSGRGGLLGQASILTVTSYDNHTSVVRRGKWILDNLLAASPPPPPPDVPALKEVHDGKLLSARQQMELHRANPACAGCHAKMDPLGFSLENFDAVGAWRTRDAVGSLDVAARMPDGTKFEGVGGLRALLLAHKDQFAAAFTQKLMTYALGRGLAAGDMPVVRSITRLAANDDYRIQTVIRGIATSGPFLTRKAVAR